MISDVDEASFQTEVVERSREVPVVVDFWAEWCGPCRTLTPALENAIKARQGTVELAKVDVDANQALAARFGIQGIPAVKAFKDGEVAEQFVGAKPPSQIESFLDSLVPSEVEELLAAGDEESLRRAHELNPAGFPASIALGRLLLARGDAEDAAEVLGPEPADFVAGGLAARAELQRAGAAPGAADPQAARLGRAFEAWDADDRAAALELLQEAFAEQAGDDRGRIRRVMVAIFTELGPDDPLAAEHRRRLSASLS